MTLKYVSILMKMLAIRSLLVLLSCYSILLCNCQAANARQNVRQFPDGFLFGTATASYQVEGAWDEDGKTENIWDRMCHKEPSPIKDESSGDIANDSYHLYKRDVEMTRELGLDFYRFSISWNRILPTSFADKINEAGVAYYNNLINELLKYNIEPMVTIFHWDLPQKLQDMGGWTNPEIVDWYADYSRVLFELFGDRVKYWITMNEPREICMQGYGWGTLAPGYTMTGMADYICAKNLLLAHAKAYRIYDEEFRSNQGGTIFITISAIWYEPESEEHVVAAEEANLFDWGIFGHPVFSETGDYPQVLKDKIGTKSAAQGFPKSRLPELTAEEVDYIKGTSDLFGLNHYSSRLVYRNESIIGLYQSPSFNDDMDAVAYSKDEWLIGDHPRTKTSPWGFYNLLRKISEYYNNVPIFVTENGYASYAGLEDDVRVTHVRLYLEALLDAVKDGSDVRGYTLWSLMDNFEWMEGYTQRFGIYEVDYDSPERTRTPRKSAFVFKEMIRTHTLDFDYEPDTTVMTIDEGH